MMKSNKTSFLLLLALGLSTPMVSAKPKAKSTKTQTLRAKAAPVNNPQSPLNRSFRTTIEQFRKGELQKKAMWDALQPFETSAGELSEDNLLAMHQVKAQILFLAGYPLLAAEFAAKALALPTEPFGENHQALWRILWTITKARPIHYVMDEIAGKIGTLDGQPPEFGTNWFYTLGNAYSNQGAVDLAKAAYDKVVMQDRYFLASQYQLALLSIRQGKAEEAETYLKAILNPTAQDLADLKPVEIAEMINFARMALGRLYYQEQRFMESAQQYRMVRKNSKLFYDSLFEQSWALFLAGSMKHGLGTLYSVHSPYFETRFNPEAKVLESMIFYWMCRYEDARTSLAEFSDQHSEAIESLSVFLDRQRLSPETAYQLFENMISGVSGAAIGIPLNVLQTSAESDSMMLARDQYASVIEEISALDTYGIYGDLKNNDSYRSILIARSASLRLQIGSRFLDELRALKEHFDELFSQSQFLYLELLMSQKEQLLGRELHAESKATKVTDKDAFAGWSRKTQSWQDSKYEYWWDEIGFQIIDVEPECKL